MQARPAQFDAWAKGYVRPLSHALRISFDKTFDTDVTFFTLDTSVLDGIDVLAPEGSDVIAEWDKYEYDPYSDRVVSMEWQREELFPYSVSQAIADIVLNNYDDYFTKGLGSPVDEYLLPQRPLRILAGFNNTDLPQFVGLTDSVPIVDSSEKTVSVHCQDFLSFIFNRPLDQTVVFQDKSTAEVLDELFQYVGLLEDQYVLDESFNKIAFVYFEKGTKLGDAVKKLMQAELGSLFMDEAGIIRFKNRLSGGGDAVYSFNESNIIDYKDSQDTRIINAVEIKSQVRVVQSEQPVYTLIQPLELVGTAPELFVSFDDPVTTLTPIVSYLVNSNIDGTGSDLTGLVTITSTELFNTAAKITFSNPSGGSVYLTSLSIFGTPAKVARNIYLRVQDDDSVEKYEEQVYTIENEFVQSNDGASSLALSILNLYKEYSSAIEMEVKGNPALQLGDNINVDYKTTSGVYTITKIQSQRLGPKFTQRISARVFNTPQFFILDQSLLNGTDVLAI